MRSTAAVFSLGLALFIGHAAHASTVVLGGDVMLGRYVRDQIVRRGQNSGTWALQNVAALFRSADLAFVNLESPFAPGPALGNSLVFRADPMHATALTSAGIDVVSFANNHARNQGAYGIEYTLNLVRGQGIAVAGAGKATQTAYLPQYRSVGNELFAFLAYTYNESTPRVEAQRPTVAAMDTGRMQAAVRHARQRGAFVVVSMHAGTEYTLTRTKQQQTFARAAIDAGAGMVVGHHPHWVQGVEVYKGKPILYSLGNLVFDQPWSAQTQQGAVAVVQVRAGKATHVQLKPVKIDFASQPRWMSTKEAAPVLSRIGLPSGTVQL